MHVRVVGVFLQGTTRRATLCFLHHKLVLRGVHCATQGLVIRRLLDSLKYSITSWEVSLPQRLQWLWEDETHDGRIRFTL